MLKALVLPLNLDLTEFTQFLWQHDLQHRVIVTEHEQQLWVPKYIDPVQIQALFQLWQAGTPLSRIQIEPVAPAKSPFSNPVQIAKRAWLSVLVIFTSVMLTYLSDFGDKYDLLGYFTLTPVWSQDGPLFTTNLEMTLSEWQLWRLITPAFLHFSFMHLVFNLLWIWVIATRIEMKQGRICIAGLFLFSAITSNLAQYWHTGPWFGGMSGVVFAVLAYAWLWDRVETEKIGVPPVLMGLLIVWLVLGYSGVLEFLQLGAIANTAHLVGLLAGVLFLPVGRWLARYT